MSIFMKRISVVCSFFFLLLFVLPLGQNGTSAKGGIILSVSAIEECVIFPKTVTLPVSSEAEEPAYPSAPQIWEDGTIYNPVPKYNQLDYPKTYYGNYSVATDGCGITCAAMVCSYLRNEEILPDELANRFRDTYGNLTERMEQACTLYDVHFHKEQSWDKTVQALRDGKVVITEQSGRSLFTSISHFIILNGISPDKKFFAIDPFGLNYGKFDLQEGFQTGFPEGHVSPGFAGAWIFDFYEPPQVGPTQYPNLKLSEEDLDLLVRFVWYYGMHDSNENQQSLAELLLNRLVSGQYPSTSIKDVIDADEDWVRSERLKDTNPAEVQYKLVQQAIDGPNILPLETFHFDDDTVKKSSWDFNCLTFY